MYLMDEVSGPPAGSETQEQLATEMALEELGLVYAFLYRRVGNRDDAEDLTQDVAVRAVPRLKDGRKRAEIRAYLFATARSVLAEFWSIRLGEPIAELHDDVRPGSEEASISGRAISEVQRILCMLPAHYRRLLELRFLRGYSGKETAAEMRTTVGSVKVMQLRALRAAAAAGLGRTAPTRSTPAVPGNCGPLYRPSHGRGSV